jgi:NAD(P)H dehydrogenase (quinone)
MTVAITGASGQLGRRVAEGLLDVLDPQKLVLVTRTPESLSELAAGGVEVRAAGFDQPATLDAAFAGVERLLLISTDLIDTRLDGHLAAIRAADRAGVRHIVYTSMANPSDDNPALAAPSHRATEDALRAGDAAYTILRNAIYADMLLAPAAGAIAAGTLVTNTGDGRNGYVTRADCAAAAVAVLTGDGHEGKIYDVTGPEALDADDLAAIYGELGDTDVTVAQCDDEGWVAAMVQRAGMPEPVAQVLATFGAAQRQGYTALATGTVERLTGRPATSPRAFLADRSETLVGA